MFGAPVKFVLVVAACWSSWAAICYSQTDEEKRPEYWNDQAWRDIQDVLNLQPKTGVAKNLVLFLGDGMGVSTVTAGRILKGQLAGRTGEEELLEMDKLPYSALVKTYNVDRQTGDSAATATAYLSGVKANYETLGVDGTVTYDDCAASLTGKVKSVLRHAHDAGKSTGIVVTSRITHATPAATYAYAANRAWEHDGKVPTEAQSLGCTDIALQLVEDNPYINVILGGGRAYFTNTNQTDPEYPDQKGFRTDGRDLIQEWTDGKAGSAAQYVWRKAEFDQVDPAETDYLLGLFEPSHMQYSLDTENDTAGEPTIAAMTTKALQILTKNPKGFFLLVEGSKIDLGHHDSKAAHALHDVIAFDDAIAVATGMLDLDETLITVTADHSHMFGFGGYAPRGTPILGLVPDDGENIVLDNMRFTNILYGNGPGFRQEGRQNLTGVNTADKDYIQQSAVPMKWESHGGEDVSVFADGPMAHLFRGLHEQVYVAHVMKYAACLGEYAEKCQTSRTASAADKHSWSGFTLVSTLLLIKSIIN
ncbi:ALPL [Branchiostoma lanceolatum]|uniref:Alkaline phosphatase, tissue-nonspecific isozyme n=1 Tax=Branchiostoma lanceolatum TaxID=7740 RepID=A0A8J9W5V3_BRALA|nr:ALPL [Branchiostoma lanceolatum]